jgi:integrase
MKAIITDKLLRAVAANKRPHKPVSDQILRGFGVRFSNHGGPSFFAIRRLRGGPKQPIRLHVGRYPALSLADARERAWVLLRDLQNGIDPRQRALEEQPAKQVKQIHTYGAVAEDFIKRVVASKRTRRAIELRIRRELVKRWKDRPITNVTRADVVQMADEIVDRGDPEAARQTFVYGRRLHDWAIARGIYGLGEASPYDRLQASDLVGRKKPRQRLLSSKELALIWGAAASWDLYGPYVLLLLLLGVRRNELARSTWNEIDLEKALWVIPPERMKSDEGLSVPLPPIAVEILSALPRFGSANYVFSARGSRPFNDFGGIKKLLDKRIVALNGGKALDHWTFHDCRRTFRTALSTIGIAAHIAELCIGHRQPKLFRIYDLHRFDHEKRHAFDAHAARLMQIVAPPDDKVVPLRKVT